MNLDYLLRDISDPPHGDKTQEQASAYAPYIGKWLQVFLKDKEFNGFYRVGLIAVQNTQLLFMDEKCRAVFIDMTSVCAVSELTDENQIKKLPTILAGETIPNVRAYFIDKKCDIKLKQQQPLFGFNKPGGFYSVLVASISDEAVIARDVTGNQHMIKLSDVLFIRECL